MTVLVNDAYDATRVQLIDELENSLVERAKLSGNVTLRSEKASRAALRDLKSRRVDFKTQDVEAAK